MIHFRFTSSSALKSSIFTLCLIAGPTIVRAQEWQSQPSGTSQVLLGVSFTSTTRGYAVGTSGTIRVTSDGGNSWTSQSSGTSRFLRDVYFSDATHGTIVGESGLILRTTDGNTWSPQTSGTAQHLVHVNFFDNNIGIATGQGGVILKTTNGGANWTLQNSGTSVELPGVDMIDANTAVAVGFGGTVLRTTDGGASWNNVSAPGFFNDLRSVHFFGATGVVVSIGGGILRSTDSGQSWAQVSSGTAANLYAVQFRDANTVYAAGNSNIRVSTNGGSSWSPSTTPPFSVDLYGLIFSGSQGWAVGQGGFIVHSQGPPVQPPSVEFSAASFNVSENAGSASINVIRSGDTSGTSTVDYATSDTAGSSGCAVAGGAANARCDYTTAAGSLTFAAGESAKTILVPIVNDAYAEGVETLTISLSNPTGTSVGAQGISTLTINDDDVVTGANPITNSPFFVRMQYLDFLNREPDASGGQFWTQNIESCGADSSCREVKRVDTSAAFFLSIEFQQTGYLVERLYKVAYGSALGTSTFGGAHQLAVPIVRLNEFLPDTQRIGRGVVVLQTGWEAVLENNTRAFIDEFVGRSRFTAAYPGSMTAAQFVDTLNTNSGNALSTAERNQLVTDLASGTRTRAQVLRAVAEDADLSAAESNRAFVLMQYFGYLRRNPNDPQDADYTGYDFWLVKLNQFNGNYVAAEMVKAFITSIEYNQRFGP